MDATATAPKRAGLVLGALIAVAAVANLGLAVANVALPSIGEAFDASQTELNLVAVGYSLGLAASVLYLGAVGDRYGRKLLLVLGMILTVPADLLAAWAPSVEFLFGARVLGGLAAGMAYPTTLALIAALWSGPARTKSIALWAATGGAIAALGPLCSGILLEHFWWGSVFLLTLPLAAIGLAMAVVLVPAHVNETTEPVDHARRRALDLPRGRAHPRDQLRRGAEQGRARRSACSSSRRPRSSRSSCASDAPGTRCTTSRSQRAGRSGWRRSRGSSSSAR